MDLPLATRDLPLPMRDLPLTTRDLPHATRDLPLPTRDLPLTTRDLPHAMRDLPLAVRDLPLTTRDLPHAMRDLPLAVRDLALATRDLPLAMRDLPLPTRDLPLAVRDLPLATRDLPIATRDLPLPTRDLPLAARDPAQGGERVPETETRYTGVDRRLHAACNSAGFTGPATPPPPRKPARATWPDAEFQPPRRRMVSQGSLDSPLTPLSPAARPRSPWARSDPYDAPEDQDKEYIGFATLPNQVNRKTVKKGFTFTLMVAGESGLGKSTLINSLFLTDLHKGRKVPSAEERILQTVNIIKHTVGIEEKGVRLQLNIIDTPGFGDAVNNTESWKEVEDYVEKQLEQYFREESGLNRKNLLRPLDVECMRALHEKVNIVPVLAKADSLTPAEVRRMKIKFPECDSDEDEDFKLQDQTLKNSIPFAVIGSNLQVESDDGRRVRVENPEHSDFLLLRNTLVRTHMQDLKDVTRETHYETYRARAIQSMTRWLGHESDNEKEQLILEKDEELRRMQEVLERIKEQMQQNCRDDF
ncbi:hypothetical protein NHX12_010589 [Muraenolepis orangiensis]|uniref:Septin-type G domain-containing protein n=1 Tax=Muraenolepis orangiensis TaxID=630683 RepID=A0A9Q0DK24_9TELE|nr:hypothetical protein NHX12_010589 [Muraenolepis orangiensis]